MSMDKVTATVYLQVEPEYGSSYFEHDDPRSIRGARVVNSTQNRSKKPRAGVVEVKITVELPKSAFLPLRPQATVVIPESLTVPHPIEVEAADANEAAL